MTNRTEIRENIIGKWQFAKIILGDRRALCVNPYGIIDDSLLNTFAIGFVGIPCANIPMALPRDYRKDNVCKLAFNDYLLLNNTLIKNGLIYSKKKRRLMYKENGKPLPKDKILNFNHYI